jgi:hypothetical protein
MNANPSTSAPARVSLRGPHASGYAGAGTYPPIPRTEPCRSCVGYPNERRAVCRACGGSLRRAVQS